MIWRALGVLTLLAIVATFGSCSTERRDWRSAQAADTIESYGRFLAEHPEGELAADARARIEQLAEERDWKRATQTDSAAAYERFLNQHPRGRWAQEARIRAESFVLSDDAGPAPASPPSHRATDPGRAGNGAGFSVQLGAFGTEAKAREHWQRLRTRFASQLRGYSAEIEPADTSAGALYRLQVPAANEAAARALCSSLAAERQACVIVLPRG